MNSETVEKLCKICKKDFHNIYQCPYLIIEPNDNFMSYFNKCKYNLVNKKNWPLPIEIVNYIQDIVTCQLKEEISQEIKNSYTTYPYSDEITYKYINNVRENLYLSFLLRSDFYYRFSLGFGLFLIVKVNKLYLPLIAYKYHISLFSYNNCNKILKNLTKNCVCVN